MSISRDQCVLPKQSFVLSPMRSPHDHASMEARRLAQGMAAGACQQTAQCPAAQYQARQYGGRRPTSWTVPGSAAPRRAASLRHSGMWPQVPCMSEIRRVTQAVSRKKIHLA